MTFAGAGSLAPAAKAAQTKTVTYKIKGFSCITCAVGLDVMLRRNKGVLRSNSTYPEAITTIDFDPNSNHHRQPSNPSSPKWASPQRKSSNDRKSLRRNRHPPDQLRSTSASRPVAISFADTLPDGIAQSRRTSPRRLPLLAGRRHRHLRHLRRRPQPLRHRLLHPQPPPLRRRRRPTSATP